MHAIDDAFGGSCIKLWLDPFITCFHLTIHQILAKLLKLGHLLKIDLPKGAITSSTRGQVPDLGYISPKLGNAICVIGD